MFARLMTVYVFASFVVPVCAVARGAEGVSVLVFPRTGRTPSVRIECLCLRTSTGLDISYFGID